MTAATVQKSIPTPFVKKKKPKRISWATFEKKYLAREDAWKYEWVNGVVEKTKRAMYQNQFYILANLRKCFRKLIETKKTTGFFEPEIDTFFLEDIHRRPDLAYFSEAQQAFMAYGENQVPAFVIEIISSNDQVNRLQKKMKNYREAGVKVIWQIFPEVEEVHVVKGNSSKIYSGTGICSAAPVLPDFRFSVKDIFKKPPKPPDAK